MLVEVPSFCLECFLNALDVSFDVDSSLEWGCYNLALSCNAKISVAMLAVVHSFGAAGVMVSKHYSPSFN